MKFDMIFASSIRNELIKTMLSFKIFSSDMILLNYGIKFFMKLKPSIGLSLQ